jgi:hypothetical protein
VAKKGAVGHKHVEAEMSEGRFCRHELHTSLNTRPSAARLQAPKIHDNLRRMDRKSPSSSGFSNTNQE